MSLSEHDLQVLAELEHDLGSPSATVRLYHGLPGPAAPGNQRDLMPKVTQHYRDARRGHILAAARRRFLRDGFHVSAEAVATILLSVVPGCILQLALTGPEAVSETPRAVRALGP